MIGIFNGLKVHATRNEGVRFGAGSPHELFNKFLESDDFAVIKSSGSGINFRDKNAGNT